MPRGQCRQRRIISFLEPCLLLQLLQSEAHGYGLMNGLTEFGFNAASFDPSLIYRVLREMEDAGLVKSQWGEESQGPQRRVYTITPDGADYLKLWVEDLKRNRQQIDYLLARYNAVINQQE